MSSNSSEQRPELLADLPALRACAADMTKQRENFEQQIENLRRSITRADQRALAALQQGREDLARQILVKKAAAQKVLADAETQFQKHAALEKTLTRRLREHEARAEAIVRSPPTEFWGDLAERARLRQERLDAIRERHGLTSTTARTTQTRIQPQADVARRPPGTPFPPLPALLAELDALTGLASVKADIRQLIDMTRVEQKRRAAGLPVAQISRHLIFTGNPGTGKTTVARLIAHLYAAIGVLPTGQLVEVICPGLSGQRIYG
ncbi:MAG: PspA/IM30 family protein [Streptosporangiaceae bacterium]